MARDLAAEEAELRRSLDTKTTREIRGSVQMLHRLKLSAQALTDPAARDNLDLTITACNAYLKEREAEEAEEAQQTPPGWELDYAAPQALIIRRARDGLIAKITDRHQTLVAQPRLGSPTFVGVPLEVVPWMIARWEAL